MLEPVPPTCRHSPIDRAFWLEHCEGYRVESASGRIGFVDEVRPNGLLAVRAGVLGRRVIVFDPEDVFEIVPRAKRIYLETAAVPLSTEPAEAVA